MHLGQPRLSRITGPHAPNVPAGLARQVRKGCGKDALPKEWDVFVQDGTVPDSCSLNKIAAVLVRNGQAEALAALVEAAGRDQPVHLDLGGQGLDGEPVATTLKEFLETASSEGLVLTIDLNSNRIGDREIEILAPALSKSQAVVSLNLSNNPLGAEAAKCLAEVLHSPCLQRLDLSRCEIDESGIEALEVSLRSFQGAASIPLVVLTNDGAALSDGTKLHVSVEDLRAIQDALSSGDQIQLLIEHYMQSKNCEALTWLVHEAAMTQQGFCLSLHGVEIDDKNVGTLFECLRKLPASTMPFGINLASTGITSGDAIEIIAALTGLLVTQLDLSGNPINITDGTRLCQSFLNSSLQRLELNKCSICKPGAQLDPAPGLATRAEAKPQVVLTNNGVLLDDGTHLDVSGNDLLDLYDALSSAKDTQYLVRQYLSSRAVDALTLLIHEAARMQQPFWFSPNDKELETEDVNTIVTCLRKLPVFTVPFGLNLSGASLGSAELLEIFDALVDRPVASLDLCANSISDEAATSIADKLFRSGFLKRMLVDGAYLSDVACSILSDALSKSELIFLGGMRQSATLQVGEASTVAARVSSEAIATWQACRESLLPASTVSRSERLHLPPQEPPQNVEVDLATMIGLDLATWALQHSLLLKAFNQRYMFTEDLAAREREVRQGRKAQEGFPPPDLAQMADSIVRQGGENCYGHADWNFAMLAAKIRQVHEEHPELRPYLPDVFVATDENAGDRLEGGSGDDGHQYLVLTFGNGSGKQLMLDSWVLYPMVHPFEDGDYKIHDVLDRYEAGSDLTARKRVVHPDILKRLDDLSQRNHDSQLLSRAQYADQNHYTAAHWDVSYSYRPDAPRCTYTCGSMVFDPDRVSENFELRINWGKQIDWMLQNIAKAPRLARAADLSPLRASDPLLKL
ncbi:MULTISPECIES: hypothetical protein [unclassified Variovorax]|uniref:hypothetical protein n=1 Tax=unclassified Variovorax TaxID=663243 RepID=UPI00076BECFD|nr:MULTISPECIES: hypothetical protein [unclassified Variovorax]KWT83617.1 hypothetical protein APY03_4610 [Variovorax sp. WDL1]PNG52064.1 hypothetical protein CHC07_04435 [Variovorax sp. B4]PNG54604.1 hypothetical protein CHC06_03401 [Variovorax sp. B2]VTV15581.1 Ran GTPase-activating protein (RanGAP) involved in mRNA processing and transport [Variovorax sp. WDL1]